MHFILFRSWSLPLLSATGLLSLLSPEGLYIPVSPQIKPSHRREVPEYAPRDLVYEPGPAYADYFDRTDPVFPEHLFRRRYRNGKMVNSFNR